MKTGRDLLDELGIDFNDPVETFLKNLFYDLMTKNENEIFQNLNIKIFDDADKEKLKNFIHPDAKKKHDDKIDKLISDCININFSSNNKNVNILIQIIDPK